MAGARFGWNSPYPRWSFRCVEVPVALLLSRDLTPAAKFLWIRLRFDEMRARRRAHSPRRLASLTCLARSTVYQALRQAEATGWLVSYRDSVSGTLRWRTACPIKRMKGERHRKSRDEVVRIPVDLLRAAHTLRPQAILCYGILQLIDGFNANRRTGTLRWVQLQRMTGLHFKTLQRAVRALVETRWLALATGSGRKPVWYRLQHADEAYANEVRRRLDECEYVGETLMRSYLSLIVDSKESEDGARPEFLVNPATGERLELDRYYPVHRVAFEFNGSQHYVAGGRFTKQEVAAQKRRDRVKFEICQEKKIKLVVVHAKDLTLKGMLEKVRGLLPVKALQGFRQTIRCLEAFGGRYLAAATGAGAT